MSDSDLGEDASIHIEPEEFAWLTALGAPPSDATILFSETELSVLATICELPRVPLLPYDPLRTFDAEARETAGKTTRLSLRGRNILAYDANGGLEVAAPVRALLELVANPYLVGRVRVGRDGGIVEWQSVCAPDAAVRSPSSPAGSGASPRSRLATSRASASEPGSKTVPSRASSRSFSRRELSPSSPRCSPITVATNWPHGW